MDSSDLINYFKSNNVRFRIEVEGKASDLQWEGIKPNGDNSVKVLPEYSNKWGVEYRLYFNGNIPDKYQYLVRQNSFYNTDMYKNVINNNGILFYSMWKGYLENDEMKQFINFMKEKEVKIIKLHTSGHADIKTIDALIKKTEPEYIITIHTENAKWFERYSGCKIIHDYQYNFW